MKEKVIFKGEMIEIIEMENNITLGFICSPGMPTIGIPKSLWKWLQEDLTKFLKEKK